MIYLKGKRGNHLGEEVMRIGKESHVFLEKMRKNLWGESFIGVIAPTFFSIFIIEIQCEYFPMPKFFF